MRLRRLVSSRACISSIIRLDPLPGLGHSAERILHSSNADAALTSIPSNSFNAGFTLSLSTPRFLLGQPWECVSVTLQSDHLNAQWWTDYPSPYPKWEQPRQSMYRRNSGRGKLSMETQLSFKCAQWRETHSINARKSAKNSKNWSKHLAQTHRLARAVTVGIVVSACPCDATWCVDARGWPQAQPARHCERQGEANVRGIEIDIATSQMK